MKELRSKLDAKNYSCSDSGCEVATRYLGYQSRCLECPFPACMLDGNRKDIKTRNAEIIRRFKEGKSINKLTQEFGLARDTMYKIVRKYKESR